MYVCNENYYLFSNLLAKVGAAVALGNELSLRQTTDLAVLFKKSLTLWVGMSRY